jgi:formyl-CoA transferase
MNAARGKLTSQSAAAPPLQGIRVLEVGTLIAGPFAGRLLGDYGADVIKVEQPVTGDPLREWGRRVDGHHGSLWSLVQGRGKRSIALDLHQPEAQRIVRALASEADVLLENFRPGRLEAWGLAPERLMELNPGLVVVRISGYGQTGPLADQPCFGTIAEAVGGLRYLTGEPDRPPGRVGLSLGDSVAAMYAVIGALLALRAREMTGAGQVVDVSLAESVFSLLEGVLPEYSYFGSVRERTGNIAHNSAPTNSYACADGVRVVIGANTTPLFRRLAMVIDRQDLALDPKLQSNGGRVARASELDAAIEGWTQLLPADRVLDLLRQNRIPAGRINSIRDIVNEPQFQHRQMLIAATDERLAKPVLTPGIVPKLSSQNGWAPSLAPDVGENTGEILAEIAERLETTA